MIKLTQQQKEFVRNHHSDYKDKVANMAAHLYAYLTKGRDFIIVEMYPFKTENHEAAEAWTWGRNFDAWVGLETDLSKYFKFDIKVKKYDRPPLCAGDTAHYHHTIYLRLDPGSDYEGYCKAKEAFIKEVES